MAGTIGESFDVIVVGAGNAAFAAALAARAEGARVVVLEKASHKLRGGNTRFTGGLFRCTYNSMDDLIPIVRSNDDPSTVALDPYPHAAFQRDMDKVTSGRSDPELTAMLISRSYDTVRWMADLGVPWEFNRAVGAVPIAGVAKVKLPFGGALRVKGEGVQLSASWFRFAEESEIPVCYETHAQRLLIAQDGRVTGVGVHGPDGVQVCTAALSYSPAAAFKPTPRCALPTLVRTGASSKYAALVSTPER